MNPFLRLVLIFSGMLLLQQAAYSTTVPNTTTPETFVGPTVKASVTNRLVENTAYSLAGELGGRNVRIGGTYAWKLNERLRVKISAEYLWQNIIYSFFSGNTSSWMNQAAAGMDWQYDLAASAMRPQLDLSAYGSHAPSKALGDTTGDMINSLGVPVVYTDARRIAGSNAAGVSPALALSFWRGSRVTVALNYDFVHYDLKYQTNDQDVTGFGGTLGFNQVLTDYLGLGFTAAVRKPFNHYDVNISFARIPFLGAWTVGLFGAYTDGKHTLPDTYNVGVTADYYMDQAHDDVVIAGKARPYRQPLNDKMLAFAATPAVYMPQVLAIPDSMTQQTCALAPIQYLGAANTDPGLTSSNAAFDFSFAPLFSGPNIVYTLAVSASGGGAPGDFSINSNTGLLSYAGGDGVYELTITGSNACSSASVSFEYDNTD